MGKPSRDKGARRERELAKLLGGERIPLSGAAGGSFGSDVLWRNLRIEVKAKAREDGFKSLYGWLANADLLAVRGDRQEWLIVVPIARFLALVGDE